MKTVCELNMCTGCGLCADICPKQAIKIEDSILYLNAVIGENCIECSLCTKKCPQINDVKRNGYNFMMEGYASDESIRKIGSSGGIATSVIKAFLENGGAVCSCKFHKGEFGFTMIEDPQYYDIFKGSKYVKSNPQGIYKQISKKLNEQKKVLMIGLPCQIAAARSYIGEHENFYTIDLICHGTPSVNLLKIYAKENNIYYESLKEIAFRDGIDYGLSFDKKRIFPSRVCDNYLLSFLCGIDYTESCYSCKYANINRTGDLTLGDSWGSELPEVEKCKGISLVLCQNEKGMELLSMSNINLGKVNEEKSISQQDQLRKPVERNKNYNKFRSVFKGDNFNESVKKVLAYKCFKQRLKKVIINIRKGK